MLAKQISEVTETAELLLRLRLGLTAAQFAKADGIVRSAVNAGVDLGAGYMRSEYDGQGLKLDHYTAQRGERS